MRGALIGYGVIAGGHHDAYDQVDGLDLVAVVDGNAERRAAAERRDPSLSVYASMAELFAAEKLDFVDICTPPGSHLKLMLAALDQGCHVLCEKPFLLRMDSFAALLGRIGSCFVYPSQNYKFSPAMRQMVSHARSDAFGALLRGYFRTVRSGHARGVPEWRPDWRRLREHSGGGILQDHGTHSIYLACHLLGATPQWVSCVLGNLRDDTFTATEDTVHMVLGFPGGTEVRLDLTWAAGFRHTSYVLVGAALNVLLDNDDLVVAGGGKITRRVIPSDFDDPTHRAWFADMFRDFLASLSDPARQDELLAEAWTGCATIDAAYASAAQDGRRVDIRSWREVSKRWTT
jgi:predicted dehydrogenase